jgi:hypothetical protein
MKALALFLLSLTMSNATVAQLSVDSLQAKIDDIRLPELTDSVKTNWQRVDSVRKDFNLKADSLRNSYQRSIDVIDAQTGKIRHEIDSLNNLKLPSNKLIHKLDSLSQLHQKVEKDFNGKVDQLKSKTIGNLDKIEMTPEMKGPVEEFTQKINGFGVTNNDFVKIPSLQLPGYSIPKIDELGNLPSTDKITGLANLPSANKITGLGNIRKTDAPLGNIGDVTKQVEGLGSDVKNVSQGNLNEVKEIPKAAEAQVAKMAGVDELQKQSGIVDGYKQKLATMNDADAIKQQGMDMVQKEAMNHFAGKEKELQAAMDKMSKYKSKYNSVSSLKDLPKRPPNVMKGKPFIERVVPGVFLQFQLKNSWLFDVNPYTGYKLSGRFIPGIGWNQRFVYDNKAATWFSRSRIYGPRAFIDFKVGKGFLIHFEQEAMNTYVPSRFHQNTDLGKREWVWSTMVGMKKIYKIYKNLNGTVLIQYNLTNQYFKTPYLDKLNSRMGFEYVLKRKGKKN